MPEDLGSSFADQFTERQAAARAERDAAVAASAEEAASEPSQDGGRSRDERGRFTTVEADADSGGDDTDPDSEPPAGARIPEGFEDFEDLLEKYNGDPREALKAFKHQQELFGRQAWELGELRKQMQETNDRLQSWEEQPEPVDPAAYDRLFEQNPGQAIAQAIQDGHLPDSPVYERLMDAWVEEDPKAARVDTKIRSALQQQMYEQRLQELQAPILQSRTQQEFTEAYARVQAKVPDLNELPLMEAAKLPWFQQAIANARSVEEREGILLGMATYARGMSVPSIQHVAQQAQVEAEAEARRQRDMAVVASASQVNREPPQTREQRMRQQIMDAAMEYTSDHTRGLERGVERSAA